MLGYMSSVACAATRNIEVNGHAIYGMMSIDLFLFGMLIVCLEAQLHDMRNLIKI